MAIKLFSVGDNLELIINKNALLGFTSFKNIIRRVVPIEGDSDGRKKEYAKRELLYIYHIADMYSLPNTKRYNKKQAHNYALSKSGLPMGYVPDIEVEQAIMDYKLEQSNVGSETVDEIIKTFNLTQKIIKMARLSIEGYLVKGTLNKDEMKEMLGILQNVITFSSEVPALIKELYKAIIESEITNDSNVDLVRGTNEPVPDSMDPSKSY